MALVWVGKLAQKEDLDSLTALANEYYEAHCDANNASNYASQNATYYNTHKGSYYADYCGYNSYNSGKLSTNYSPKYSSYRGTYFGGFIR